MTYDKEYDRKRTVRLLRLVQRQKAEKESGGGELRGTQTIGHGDRKTGLERAMLEDQRQSGVTHVLEALGPIMFDRPDRTGQRTERAG